MNYGFLIDNRVCIGCHACSTACKQENAVPLVVDRIEVTKDVADRARSHPGSWSLIVHQVVAPEEFLGGPADKVVRGAHHGDARTQAIANRSRNDLVETRAAVQANTGAAAATIATWAARARSVNVRASAASRPRWASIAATALARNARSR